MNEKALLRRLLDERDISVQLAALARILDTRAWDRVSEIVAPEVSFDYSNSGTDETGLDALLVCFRRFLDVCGPSQHLIGSAIVEVDGDRATSRCYVQARHRSKDASDPRLFDSNGEYIDTWERHATGWRMIRRVACWHSHSGDPAVIGL